MTPDQIMAIADVLEAQPERIQGFSYGENFTAPHVVRDVYLPRQEQELWRGDSHEEMMRQCRFHRLRLAIEAC